MHLSILLLYKPPKNIYAAPFCHDLFGIGINNKGQNLCAYVMRNAV